ncbi:hypothetical protein LCGC14_1494320 [marine sediment metagenome]|uniref:Uncharacterized protein n=1 Tax=marine sediment metagenome TaxID=412755 RepID=A0A0F9M7E4_9ZZZZ
MVDKNKFKEIVLMEKEQSLHISRVPTKIKQKFVEVANEEFSQDYGMCLKWCLEQALEYQQMKPLLTMNFQPEKSTPIGEEEQPAEHTMLSGRKVKGGKKNE